MMSDALRAGDSRHCRGRDGIPARFLDGPPAARGTVFRSRRGQFLEEFCDLDLSSAAILAIVALYFAKLWRVAFGMFSNPDDRRFVIGLLVSFSPAAVIGAAAGGYIKAFLFNPWVVCFSLIVGGAILLWIDQLDLDPHEHDATTFPLPMYLGMGFAQCLAMIPGVSRSGASIVAAMLFGADKHAAAEFSFFLAHPSMVGAFVYEFYKNRADISFDHMGIIAIGFVVSFITAMIVVKTFLAYVTRHGFTLFAWWRVIVGTLGLVALAMGR